MKVITTVVGSLQTNCYLLIDEETKLAAFIDPGDDAEKLLTDEVALALALPRQEVPAYLHKRLAQPEAADQQLP